MTKDEVILRIKEELKMPGFNANIEDKEYSEADYLKLKTDLLNYYQDYVGGIEADFQGGLDGQIGR
ncbi:MAG: hypothetical protein LKF42_08285 [Streptococcaceae bacterium]|jgi:hypothetical protein|nr:hypothetical protein [Streptococcaceae bacterium]MCH4177858.1 hypothetical protein [Streptococcaceae bacterium]